MAMLTESKSQIISPMYFKQNANTSKSSQIYFVRDKNGNIKRQSNYLDCLFYAEKHPEYTIDCFTTNVPNFSENIKNSDEIVEKILNGDVVTISVGKNYMIESLICSDLMFESFIECGMINQVEDDQTTYDDGHNSQPQMSDYLKQSGNDLDKVINDLGQYSPNAVIIILSEDGMDANSIADSFSVFNDMSTSDNSPKELGNNSIEKNDGEELDRKLDAKNDTVFSRLSSIGDTIANKEAKGFNIANQMDFSDTLDDYTNEVDHQHNNKILKSTDYIGSPNV